MMGELQEAIFKLFRLARSFPNKLRLKADSRDHPTAVRAAFREYSDFQRQFMSAADTCSHKGWPDRGAVLYNRNFALNTYCRGESLKAAYGIH